MLDRPGDSRVQAGGGGNALGEVYSMTHDLMTLIKLIKDDCSA